MSFILVESVSIHSSVLFFLILIEIRNDLIVCNELSEIEKIHYVEILLKMSRTKALKGEEHYLF